MFATALLTILEAGDDWHELVRTRSINLLTKNTIRSPTSRHTTQYNILLLQSQTDRCESDIHNDM